LPAVVRDNLDGFTFAHVEVEFGFVRVLCGMEGVSEFGYEGANDQTGSYSD
jgi:hypothetical protein